jgi:pyruvate kinase
MDRLDHSELVDLVLSRQCLRAVQHLLQDVLAMEQQHQPEIEEIPLEYRASAANLIHYLAVRRHDIRELQGHLSRLGLSSLGTMEAHVLASLRAVTHALVLLTGQTTVLEDLPEPTVDLELGQALLEEHSVEILGEAPEPRQVRIMVTLPSEAAEDPNLIRQLLAHGMDIVRINCAHDGPEAWAQMLEHLRTAEADLGHQCRVSFDLAGPKLRTGAIAPGPAVLHWRPRRNPLGAVLDPACIRLEPYRAGEPPKGVLPVKGNLPRKASPGDVVRLKDARGRDRSLSVIRVDDQGCWCECDRTGYITPSTSLRLLRKGKLIARGQVGPLPLREEGILLVPGDQLRIDRLPIPGEAAQFDPAGQLLAPAHISCSLPSVFATVRPGQRIHLDDGKFRGVIRDVAEDHFWVDILQVAGGRATLKAEKGINLPDTDLSEGALTEKDCQDLDFIAAHADMVALSFVQRSEDVEQLIQALERRSQRPIGIVLKIESARAFNQFPKLLLTAMRHPPVAVMIARGDLGVELGFERLAEVQEELLWLCEAAHVPVIWATQVLESFAKAGAPSRAEVTDASMGSRAECIMLNKGPYIIQALQLLQDILQRMQEHQHKRTATLRRLHVSEAIDPIRLGPLVAEDASLPL